MNEDFNPFDLSAVPKAKVEAPPEAPPAAQPVVNRVSFGPLFHSRVTKVVAFILAVVLLALVGYIGMNFYLTRNDNKKTSAADWTVQLPA